MSPLATGVIVFACVCGGAVLGTFFSALLPQAQIGSDSRDVVRLTMGLVATTVAIVLGMRVASAKSFYDTQDSEVTQMAANFPLLDRVLVHYGQETAGTRAALRAFLPEMYHPDTGLRRSLKPRCALPLNSLGSSQAWFLRSMRLLGSPRP
jgi:hypothetical protein